MNQSGGRNLPRKAEWRRINDGGGKSLFFDGEDFGYHTPILSAPVFTPTEYYDGHPISLPFVTVQICLDIGAQSAGIKIAEDFVVDEERDALERARWNE